MSPLPTEEQRQLQQILREFCAAEISSEYIRARTKNQAGEDPELWRKLKELGLFEMFGDESGADRARVYELCLIARECGYGLVPEHLSERLTTGPYLLAMCGTLSESAQLDSAMREKIMRGDARISLAQVRRDRSRLTISSGDSRISGCLDCVPEGEGADFLVLILHNPDLSCRGLLCSPRAAASYTCERLNTVDLTRCFHAVTFQNMPFKELSRKDGEQVSLVYELCAAAHISGASERAVAMTADFVTQREQFGVPVGGFQAVQRLVADSYVLSEAMRALLMFAAWSADHSREQFSLAARAAVQFACEHGGSIVERCIQAHGGIGFTWEYDLHLYLRRIKLLEALHRFEEDQALAFLQTVARDEAPMARANTAQLP